MVARNESRCCFVWTPECHFYMNLSKSDSKARAFFPPSATFCVLFFSQCAPRLVLPVSCSPCQKVSREKNSTDASQQIFIVNDRPDLVWASPLQTLGAAVQMVITNDILWSILYISNSAAVVSCPRQQDRSFTENVGWLMTECRAAGLDERALQFPGIRQQVEQCASRCRFWLALTSGAIQPTQSFSVHLFSKFLSGSASRANCERVTDKASDEGEVEKKGRRREKGRGVDIGQE